MDKTTKDEVNIYLELISEHGRREDVEKLHELIGASMHYIASKYFKNEFDVDDLTQQFWADIFDIAQGYKYKFNGFGYLCKVMTNRAINKYREIKGERDITLEYVSYYNYTPITENDIDEDIDKRTIVRRSIAKLDEQSQYIINETYYLDKTVREIATDLNMSKSNVEKLKQEALIALGKHIENYYLKNGQKPAFICCNLKESKEKDDE